MIHLYMQSCERPVMTATIQDTQPKYLKYLTIYNADINWQPYVDEVWTNLASRMDREKAQAELKKRIACAMLLPFYEKHAVQNPPQNLLFFCHKWTQYNSRDWVKEYQEVLSKDIEIERIRKEALRIGVIAPLEYNPNTREAFNWLYNQAKDTNALTESNKDQIKKNMQSLVYAYGGVIISNIVFNKPEWKTKINNIPNWRSGYFFERLIHEVYSETEILKIKTHEINRMKHSDSKLVKMVQLKEED